MKHSHKNLKEFLKELRSIRLQEKLNELAGICLDHLTLLIDLEIEGTGYKNVPVDQAVAFVFHQRKKERENGEGI